MKGYHIERPINKDRSDSTPIHEFQAERIEADRREKEKEEDNKEESFPLLIIDLNQKQKIKPKEEKERKGPVRRTG